MKTICHVLILLALLFAACAHTETLSSTHEDITQDAPETGDGSVSEPAVNGDDAGPGFSEEKQVADPLEPWNRAVFTFNDRLYFWVMKPAAKGYNAVFPEWLRNSVRNFFQNLSTPVRFVNDLLQGKLKSAGNELVRLCVNSTYGLGGLLDAAKKHFDLKSEERDLGMTLGFYGIGEGVYIVWPFLGPSSIRDTVGKVGDGYLSPVNYVTPTKDAIAITAYEYFNDVSLRIGDYESLKEAAVDPYIAVRDAYVQHRRYLINK